MDSKTNPLDLYVGRQRVLHMRNWLVTVSSQASHSHALDVCTAIPPYIVSLRTCCARC